MNYSYSMLVPNSPISVLNCSMHHDCCYLLVLNNSYPSTSKSVSYSLAYSFLTILTHRGSSCSIMTIIMKSMVDFIVASHSFLLVVYQMILIVSCQCCFLNSSWSVSTMQVFLNTVTEMAIQVLMFELQLNLTEHSYLELLYSACFVVIVGILMWVSCLS
jgi:hypothetical protein